MSPNAHLLATCWTTAGDAAPDRPDQGSPLGLRERAEAAAAAGFTGFGLVYADLLQYEHRYGLAGVRSILDDSGLSYIEVEALTDWWTDGAVRAASDATRTVLLKACEELGAHHIKIHGDVDNGGWDADRAVGELARLASDADKVGAKIGIEFLPWSKIQTVHDALRLCEACGHPGAGIIIDAWHTERGGTPPADLAAVPPERIVGVELCDADAEVVGTLFDDTAHRRKLCGHGDFDLPAFVAAIRQAGWNGPWGVEILSDEFRRLPVHDASAAAFQSAAALMT